MPAQKPAIYVFAARYSIPKHEDRCFAEGLAPEMEKFLRFLGADKFIFQLEDSWKELSDEERQAKFLEANVGKLPCETLVNHNLHFQIYFHLKEKARCTALKKIANDSDFRGMYISPASNAGKHALKEYAMKADTRVAGPFADRSVYLGADLISPLDFSYEQKKLYQYLKQVDPVKDKCNRCVIWIYDPTGGSGKSAFKKYCQFTHRWAGFTYANAKDILYIVNKFPNKRVYFFNLSKTRSAEVSEAELYAALESIKDGDFTSTKYEPEMVLMNPAHVVVFANHKPKKSKMTRDRFKIIKWKPLPRSVIADKCDFDWGDCEELTYDDLSSDEEEPPKPRRRKRKRQEALPPLEAFDTPLKKPKYDPDERCPF